MMRRVYLDSCIVIYLVEEHPDFTERLQSALSAPGITVCHSPLVELECLVHPLKMGDESLMRKYTEFFSFSCSLGMPPEVFREAARLRAEFNMKTPDALHAAVAKFHACDELWTNDDRLVGAMGSLAINFKSESFNVSQT